MSISGHGSAATERPSEPETDYGVWIHLTRPIELLDLDSPLRIRIHRAAFVSGGEPFLRSKRQSGGETVTQITGAMADALIDSAPQNQRTTACFLAAISSRAPQSRFSPSRYKAHGRRRPG